MSSYETITPPRLARYLRQVYLSRKQVLQFSRERDALSVWNWPMEMSKEPVSPSLLHKYCLVHNIPGPGCLCPLKDQDKRNPSFVEAAIIVDVLGGHPNSGEHFAKCSAGICGYFVPLQRIYNWKSAEFYAKLTTQPALARPYRQAPNQDFMMKSAPALKRSHASLDLDAEAYTIPVQVPSSRQATDSEILLKLDDYTQPGLYEKEFRALLERMVKCSCGMVMLQRVYPEHRCDRAIFRPMKRQRLNNIDIEEAYSEWEVYSSTGGEGDERSDEEDERSNEEVRSDEEEEESESLLEQMYED